MSRWMDENQLELISNFCFLVLDKKAQTNLKY